MPGNVNIAELVFSALETRRMVVLPGLGSFVRDDRDGSIIFSQLMDGEDGVLRRMASEAAGDPMKGDALVDRFIFDIRSSLDDTGVCRIGTFGTMAVTRNGSIVFHRGATIASAPNAAAQPSAAEPRITPPKQATEETRTQPRQKKLYYHKRRRQTDKFLTFSIVVIILSLAAIAYGVYVSRQIESQEGMEQGVYMESDMDVETPKQ